MGSRKGLKYKTRKSSSSVPKIYTPLIPARWAFEVESRISSLREGWHTSPDLWINQRSLWMPAQKGVGQGEVCYQAASLWGVSMTKERNTLLGGQVTGVGCCRVSLSMTLPLHYKRSLLQIIQYGNSWRINFSVLQNLPASHPRTCFRHQQHCHPKGVC